jgi:GGDEF domain-containing protein
MIDNSLEQLTAKDLGEMALSGDQKAIQALVRRASTKERTGLLNEHDFPIEIKKEQSRVQRGQSVGGVVLNIDLAGFKRINDLYGERQGGDVALKAFADHLNQSGFRDIDIIANPGGDEFFVILTNTAMDVPCFELGTPKISDEFKNACTDQQKLWFKLEKFIQSCRVIYFEGTDKNRNDFSDLIRARITVASYGNPEKGQPSLEDAISHSEKLSKPQKKLTEQYVLGGR